MAGTPNQGFYLSQVGGAGPFDFYAREHTVSAERPHLTVVTDAGSFVLTATADTHLRTAGYGSRGNDTTFRISGDRNRALIRFDLSMLPAGARVTGAKLELFSFAEYGGSSMQVGVFRVFHDLGSMPPLVTGGFSRGI